MRFVYLSALINLMLFNEILFIFDRIPKNWILKYSFLNFLKQIFAEISALIRYCIEKNRTRFLDKYNLLIFEYFETDHSGIMFFFASTHLRDLSWTYFRT